MEGRHDRKKPGRPSRLSAEGQKDVSADLKEEPFKHGFERGTWNAPLLVLHIGKKFGVWYSVSGALALAHRLNFSVRKSRPVHHKTATPEVIKEYVNKTVATIKEHAAAGYTVLCLDAAAVRNTGSSARGIRLRGGRETVSVNFSMVSTTMIGALGVGKHHINFCKSANSANVI